MLIACVQTDIDFADVNANLARVLDWLGKAAEAKAELVVFPECMLTGYGFDSRQAASEVAISIDSSIVAELVQAAKAHDLHLTLGFLESASDQANTDQLYNSSALIGPTGVVGVYRKIHLPQLGVDRFVDRGDVPYQTLPAGEAKIGLAICYDCSFPEPMRVLGLAGADIIALGTNWPVTAARTAEVVPPARSMENHLFFVAANRIGEENGFTFCGRSSICGPDGVVLAQSDNDLPVVLLADVDLAQARNKRIERTKGAHVIDRFLDRRPEFYQPVAENGKEVTQSS